MGADISIVEYSDVHQQAFKALNIEWLQAYHLLEARDMVALDDPRGTIIHPGGVIYLALHEGNVVGSAAVIYEHGEFELAKMAVAQPYRGQGISKILLDRCVQFAKERGAEKILLYSNHQLTSALALYKKYGFKDVPVTDSPFATADVKMEMRLID